MSPSSALAGWPVGVGVRGGRGTLHDPIGLLDGALVGWKLSNVVVAARNLAKARAAVFDRLDEIAADLLRDVDRQVNVAVGVAAQRAGAAPWLFAADPYQQFEVVQRIHEDPSQLQAHRADAERFVQAFVACAIRARRTVGVFQNVEPIPV